MGNCDNHLKNLSFLYGREWRGFRLAPAYDLVSTTRYDRFSRDMGMQIGSTRAIDDISIDDFFAFANEVGVNRSELQKICAQIAEMGHKAIYNSSDISPRFDAIPIVADDFLEEMGQREYLLRQIAE